MRCVWYTLHLRLTSLQAYASAPGMRRHRRQGFLAHRRQGCVSIAGAVSRARRAHFRISRACQSMPRVGYVKTCRSWPHSGISDHGPKESERERERESERVLCDMRRRRAGLGERHADSLCLGHKGGDDPPCAPLVPPLGRQRSSRGGRHEHAEMQCLRDQVILRHFLRQCE